MKRFITGTRARWWEDGWNYGQSHPDFHEDHLTLVPSEYRMDWRGGFWSARIALTWRQFF